MQNSNTHTFGRLLGAKTQIDYLLQKYSHLKIYILIDIVK